MSIKIHNKGRELIMTKYTVIWSDSSCDGFESKYQEVELAGNPNRNEILFAAFVLDLGHPIEEWEDAPANADEYCARFDVYEHAIIVGDVTFF